MKNCNYQEPLVNINTGAVALTGTVIVAGAATALIWKSFMKDQFYYRKGNGRQESMNQKQKKQNKKSIFIQFTVQYLQ